MTYLIAGPCIDVLDRSGRSEAIGGPGGAADVGRVGTDTPLVTAHPVAG